MPINETTYEPMLKTLYPPDVIRNEVYRKNPFLALLPKDETFGGDASKEPIIIGNPQNRSASFAVANSYVSSSLYRNFLITRVPNYSIAQVFNETLLASQSEKGAFAPALKAEMDNAIRSLSNAIASQLFRGGTGTLGQIAATATLNSASVPVQFAQPEDGVNFEAQMSIAFSATDGGTPRSGTAYIVSIDHVAGNFLCSATVGGTPTALSTLVPGVSVGDYVYASSGDQNSVISGALAWLPGSSVSNTPFFGVDRTVDKSRMAGITYDGSAETIEEALIDGAALIAREGGAPEYAFMSYRDFRNLQKALGSKMQSIQYTDVVVNEPGVTVGFNAIKIAGPDGELKVIPDKNCPVGKCFMIQMDTWKLKSLGPIVRLFNSDGLDMIRDINTDSVIFRINSYANLSCRAPGFNGVITLPQ